MNIAIINVLGKTKSTGKIAYGLHDYLKQCGHKSIVYYGRNDEGDDGRESDVVRISSDFDNFVHAGCARLFGNQGEYSIFATKKLLRLLDVQKPDAVYLLNLHGYYLNFSMLFKYLKERNIKAIYMMLDEYPFLGKCAFAQGCEHYRIGCGNCPKVREYPASLILDRSHRLIRKKRAAYAGLDVVFVGVQYTVDQAKQSYLLKDAHFTVIDEAVDLRKIYYPRETQELRERLGIPAENIIVVTVAPFSDPRKGGKYFLEAARRLASRRDITFVHVGFDGETALCPKNYIAIPYVLDQNELAAYYSLGDLFVCTSLAETVANTCLEALSCGTPILAFNVAGMPDCADAEHGTFVPAEDSIALTETIGRVRKKSAETAASCRAYAESRYDSEDYFKKLEQLLYQTVDGDT